MSRLLKLTKGQYATVDDEDYDFLIKWKWHAYYEKGSNSFYARRGGIKTDGDMCGKTILLHRVVSGCPDGMVVDHIYHDPLDNRKKNLRVCSRGQNQLNQLKQAHNKSGYKGVSWHKKTSKWTAQININKKKTYLGIFTTKEKAYKAYCEASSKYHGEFGCTK